MVRGGMAREGGGESALPATHWFGISCEAEQSGAEHWGRLSYGMSKAGTRKSAGNDDDGEGARQAFCPSRHPDADCAIRAHAV